MEAQLAPAPLPASTHAPVTSTRASSAGLAPSSEPPHPCPSSRFSHEVRIEKEAGSKLGITLANKDDHVVVDAVSPTSPVFGLVQVGSFLTAVDGQDVMSFWRVSPAEYAAKLIFKSSSLCLSLLVIESSTRSSRSSGSGHLLDITRE
ncbi:MAG: hypothetical protein SGPRY_013905, partial [Prymnesium sp.]